MSEVLAQVEHAPFGFWGAGSTNRAEVHTRDIRELGEI
jgi:hypothetical protein